MAPPWPHTMRVRCIGEYHTLKFFFENDASRTSFFLYSFLWPEFAPVTFDACKRHESIYLALLFFLGNNITYLRISISLKSRALFTYFSANSSFIYFLTDKKSIVLNEESYFFLPPASFKYRLSIVKLACETTRSDTITISMTVFRSRKIYLKYV